ncbi:MAG: ABC transporter permease [Phycisphaerales bacterium]
MSQIQRTIAKTGLHRVRPAAAAYAFVEGAGELMLDVIDRVGAAVLLLRESVRWIWRSMTRKKVRLGRPAIVSQLVRVGVRSVFIVSLVSGCVGLILVLQMAPPLDQFGSKDLAANILGVAILRELGPLIAAIVLTGFAGAAIAAELGTMVVGEEIEALEAQALNPVRFLVIPRVLATIAGLAVLSIISNVMAIGAGYAIGVLAVGIPGQTFWDNLLQQAKTVDFITGMVKSLVFGLLIGLIACTNGLRVSGGAAGVGKATTETVVQSVVCIVIADLIFTVIFFALNLN